MEKVFKARWWDYHNRKYNINGRICLETLFPFGIAGTILLKWANPFLLNYLGKFSENTINIVLGILITFFSIDTVISFVVIGNLRKTAKKVEIEEVKDNTEEISNMVRDVTTQKVEEIKDNIYERTDEAIKNIENIPKILELNVKKAQENVHYTGKKIYENILDSEQKLLKTRDETIDTIKSHINKSQKMFKENVQSGINSTKEFTDIVKERFSNTFLNRRFLRAFPNLQIESNKLDTKENKKK